MVVLTLMVVASCGGDADRRVAGPALADGQAPQNGAAEPVGELRELPTDLAPFLAPWKGDLDGMIERRALRVLTVRNPVLYSIDRGGREVGITYESLRAFEKQINEKLGNKTILVHAIFLPVARDELIPRLLAGEGDIAAATLTITPERAGQVDFSDPFADGVSEILVTGPASPPVGSLEDLAGREIYVRPSSSYAEHLRTLSERFVAEGRPPITISAADELLEDGDVLEMVSAGLVPATVADDFTARLWAQILPDLTLHDGIAVATGERIAWAFRKGSPQLAAEVNRFVKQNKQGTLTGNVLIKRYFKDSKWVRNARSAEDIGRFRQMAELFRKYADRYDFDWLLMAAQGYQESTLDQSKRSRVGAIGVMQVMPATARDKAIGIPDIEKLESNIHAGIKYNRWIADNYFDDPGIDARNKALFAFAGYNAGPNRIARLREKTAQAGLDPDRWFNNVEVIVAREVGREPVQYVANIYKYYLAYKLEQDARQRREAAGAG